MSPKATVLLAEDDEDAVLLLRCAFDETGKSLLLVDVPDGQAAIDYLSGVAPYDDREKYPFPQLVLLDLAMPRMGGLEVLAWLKANPALARVPVVILTTSALDADSRRAFELGAREYLMKPIGFEALVRLAQALNTRWLNPEP